MIDDNDLIGKTQKLLEDGVPASTIRTALEGKKGIDIANKTLLQALSPKISKLRTEGTSDDVIMETLQKKGITPSIPLDSPSSFLDSIAPRQKKPQAVPPQSPVYVERQAPAETLDPEAEIKTLSLENMSDEELIDHFENITNSQERDFKSLVGLVGSPSSWKGDVKRLRDKSNAVMSAQLQKRGVDVTNIDEFGTVTYIDKDTGKEVTYDEPWYESMLTGIASSKFEITGAIAGAATGAKAGAVIGGVPGAFGGGILGGMLGASTGSGADLLNSAKQVQYNIGVAELQNRMGEAATADALGALGVATLFKAGAMTLRGIRDGYDRVVQGNRHGAYQALKDTTDLNDRQIITLIEDWERHTGTTLLSDKARETGKLSYAEQSEAIHVAGQALPQLASSVNSAIDMSKTGGVKLAHEISARANDLRNAAESLTNDNVATVVTESLSDYVKATKTYYGEVKLLGQEALKDSDFRFDFKDIKPLISSLDKSADTIANYSIRRSLRDNLEEIRRLGDFQAAKKLNELGEKVTPNNLEALNANRSFDDLLALREYINQVSRDSSYKQFLNFKEIDRAKGAIDAEIVKASNMMPEGSAWLSQWKKANVEYTKMKVLEGNVLFKALDNPKVTPDKAVKAFADSLSYVGPESFMQVMGKLEPKVRVSVEGAVVKHFLQSPRNMVVFGDEVSAVNFPKLAMQLNKIAFTTKESRELKQVVNTMAKTFRTDTELAKIAWDSPAGKFKGNISTSVTGKIKMQAATYMFKFWQAFIPTRGSDRLALTLQMRRVLDNPLNAKSVTELKKLTSNDPQLSTLLHSYALEYAKVGQKESYGKVKVFRVAKKGKKSSKASTKLGDGVLHYVDEKEAIKVAKELGLQVSETEVITDLIARPSDVAKITQKLYGREPTASDYKNLAVQDLLREKFTGIASETKVILF